MVILQGDIFWLDLGMPKGSGPGFRRPHVVVQNDVFNASALRTTVICALTSNLERAKAPGNVLLRKGEANLPRPSVVNISQVITVDKSDLKEKIGTLSRPRIREIVAGLHLVFQPRELPRQE
jgi:mRNA interferase MazF